MTLSVLMTSPWPSLLFSVGLTALLLGASIYDLVSFRIPNAIPLMLIGLGLLKVALGLDAEALPERCLVFAATLALGFLLFTAGLIGGGDVKLMSALALWFDASTFASFIVLTSLIGGMIGVGLLLARRPNKVANGEQPKGSGRSTLKERLLKSEAPLPYALPIATAALWLEWYVVPAQF